MGRYYFHIKEGPSLINDPEGDDLPNEVAAVQVVRDTVDDIVTRPDLYGGLGRWAKREFVVADEHGHTVLTVSVAALMRLH